VFQASPAEVAVHLSPKSLVSRSDPSQLQSAIMKVFATALVALVAGVLAMPAENHLARRGVDVDDLFAQISVRTQGILDICADIDIDVDIDIRTKIAKKIKPDLDICADLLDKAADEIKKGGKSKFQDGNKGCDSKCVEKKVSKHSEKFCKDIEKVVKKVGKDCVGDYVKPCFASFKKYVGCLDGIFIGIGASVTAIVKGILGIALGLDLGLDLDIGLGLGGIIKIG